MHVIDIHWAFVAAYAPVALLSGYILVQVGQAIAARLKNFELIHRTEVKLPQPVAKEYSRHR